EQRLMPAMEPFGYHNPVAPIDLIFGLSGCHSSFLKRYQAIAAETGVNLFQLIVEASAINRKAPSEELIRSVAAKLPKTNA
ncbi:MAG: 4-hydroxy-2-oxovalerate aldolase, partial [Clostridia bacterium]|nr:4-hydroxy-2-oxovalerate aldolase [Clostridia bacterium]